ncbi:response regulator [Liquorilactobacillus sucicola DSM 21376 = JCM 15457]|uniref:LytTR family DNA-binding domain-containing protein n=1 Tax=Liquorilactobacillus sucicola TaxID=519050 RepID=UPI0004322B27|nr:LytTR family DNA-binding domain-containing protein [Liquorilactobacillus sucicola]GAJ25729.1 response regulator [Liquorilactobacillus sucicola DSM 21376 = JCM 15457]
MKIYFSTDKNMPADEIQVNVSAQQYSDEVAHLLAYLDHYTPKDPVLAVSTAETIHVIHQDKIISLEVYGAEIHLVTRDQLLLTRGRLYKFLEKLSHQFIQVSRYSIINLDYLQKLETGFSGNMTAVMVNNAKINVSRKYLSNLKKQLGI